MKISAPTPPPPPAPVDPGKSALDYINAMADPALQGRLLASEQQFRPQYLELGLQDLASTLYGTDNARGTLDLFSDASRRAAEIQAASNRIQREADIRDVAELGLQASEAFRQANPELMAALSRADELRSRGDLTAGLEAAISGARTFGDLQLDTSALQNIPQATSRGYTAATVATPESVARGQLGEQLQAQALAAGGLGSLGSALQGRGMEFAQSQGRLSPDEIRQIQQSVREAYTAQGRGLDSAAVSAEALERLAGTRNRMMQDLSMAAAINQANQQELAANRAFQQGVYGADTQRQFGNVANALQAGLANQSATNQAAALEAEAANRASLANQSLAGQYGLAQFGAAFDLANRNREFAAAQQQQAIANQSLLSQLRLGQLGADRNYALQLAQAQAAVASDPFQAILGRQSGALQYGTGQQGFAGQASQAFQGPQLFNPDAGINLALQNAANQANYQSAIYGAQAAYKGNALGGLFEGLGSIAGGLFKTVQITNKKP